MINLFPKTRFLTSEDTIKYVRTVLSSNCLITDFSETGQLYDKDGMFIKKNSYMGRYFYAVPNHFQFLILDDEQQDPMYRLSFLTDDNRLLYAEEDMPYHKRIATLCHNTENIISAKSLNMPVLPRKMRPSQWTDKDMENIYNRVTQIIRQQNSKPVRQK